MTSRTSACLKNDGRKFRLLHPQARVAVGRHLLALEIDHRDGQFAALDLGQDVIEPIAGTSCILPEVVSYFTTASNTPLRLPQALTSTAVLSPSIPCGLVIFEASCWLGTV